MWSASEDFNKWGIHISDYFKTQATFKSQGFPSFVFVSVMFNISNFTP